MALPPVVATLRANVSDYMARMAEARASWGETAGAIADPAPMAAAETHLRGISTHTAETAEQTRVLAETTRETYGTMRAGAQSVIPGLGELSGVLGGVAKRFTEIGAAAKANLAEADAGLEATRIETERLAAAQQVYLERLSRVEAGSAAWTRDTAKLDQVEAAQARVNKETERYLALQASAGKGVGRAGIAAAGGGIAAVGVVGAAVVGYESVKAALSDETAMALLRNAISKTKQSWAEYAPVLENVEGQMRKLGYADKDTAAAAQRLTSALHDPAKALNLVGLAANIARARHIDLATATGYVAKITTGHIGTLGRLGLASKDAAGNTLTTRQAVQALAKSYGDAATAYGTTLQGKWEIFKAQAEHVAAQIGTRLIPMLSDLLTEFMDLAHWLNENVVPTLKVLAGFYQDHAKLINALALGLLAAVAAFKLVTGAIALMNLVMDANPVVLVVAAVAALAAGFIYAYHHSETFRRIVDATFSALKTAALDAARVFVNYYVAPQVEGYLFIGRSMGKLMGIVAKLPKWLGGGIAADIQGAINDLVNTVSSGLHAIQAELSQTTIDAYKTTDALAGMALINANLANAQLRYKKDLAASAGDNVLAADLANIARLKAQAAAPPPKAKNEDPFNIGGDYSAGLQNVAEKAKKLHSTAAEDAKKRAAAAKKALAEQAARLKEQAQHALDAAKRIAEREAAQLRAALAAALEAARQLDVANKLAGGGPGALNIYDGAILNRGTSFAQAAAARGNTITINNYGRVTTEKDLLASLHEGLLTFNRTNINAGLN